MGNYFCPIMLPDTIKSFHMNYLQRSNSHYELLLYESPEPIYEFKTDNVRVVNKK